MSQRVLLGIKKAKDVKDEDLEKIVLTQHIHPSLPQNVGIYRSRTTYDVFKVWKSAINFWNGRCE